MDIDYIFKKKKINPKTQNINLTKKPKSKPAQPKYPKLTHKFITKSKEKKSMVDFKKQKQYLKREKSIHTFKICCCRDKLGQRTN